MKELLSPEIIQQAQQLAVLALPVITMALTQKQRKWILERDEYTSQMRHYNNDLGFHTQRADGCTDCKGDGCGLHVHHIEPQWWLMQQGKPLHDIDSPDNLITLHACEHTGRKTGGQYADPEKEFVVHPDMISFYQNYDGTDASLNKMRETRDELTKQGIPYWNTDHDVEMKETAKQRTMNFIMETAKLWPTRKK